MRAAWLSLLAPLAFTAMAAASNCGGDPSSGGAAGAGAGGSGGSGGADACATGCEPPDGGEDASDASDSPADATPSDGGEDASDAAEDAPDDAPADAPPEAGADAPPPCSAQGPSCPGALTCCDGACVDVHKDPLHCGACGVACVGTQFCTGEACVDGILKNACANPAATVVLDAYAVDNATGVEVGDGLAAFCAPPPAVQHLDQASPLVLEAVTDRPITGPGNTFVAGGGAFGQRGLAHLDAQGRSPLHAVAGPAGHVLLLQRSNGATLVDAAPVDLTDHHDYFAFYVAIEPQSGTLALAAFGLMGKGTEAAGWYWQNVVAPDLGTYDKVFYVYAWTDANDDASPDAGDAFTLIASGP